MIAEKINNFRRSVFVRNVATLQAGSFGGTLIQAAAGIFIARFLQPELYGVYSLAVGLAGMTSLIIGMGIQEAVSSLLGRAYAGQNKAETENILGFLFKITFWAALIVLAILVFVPALAERLYGDSLIGIYAAIISVAVILSSFLFTLSYSSFQVAGKIKSLARLMIFDQSLRAGLSLLLVVAGFGVLGAVSGHLIGAAAVFVLSAILYGRFVNENRFFPGLKQIFLSAKKAAVKKYLNFTFWVALDRNMGNVYMALPVMLTGIYATASDVSFFKLAFGYVNLALGLLGPVSILLNVEFPRLQVEDNSKLRGNFIKVSIYSMLLSVLLTAVAVIVSPLAFKLLYGESFLPSVKYVWGMVLYGAFYGIGVGLGPMWRAINKVRVSILINLVILGAGIPSGLWLIKNYGPWGSVIMVTVWFTVSHGVSFAYLIKKLR